MKAGRSASGSQTAGAEGRAVERRKPRQIDPLKLYDPANPFTYWYQGTNKCNQQADHEEQERRKHVRSANACGRRIPYHLRALNTAKAGKKEGVFRQIKNQKSKSSAYADEAEFDVNKEEVIRNNLIKYESQDQNKFNEIKFNEVIYQPTRIPTKKFIEYKRDIRLSILRKEGIIENINDMKNLIIKANEELEENIGTEKNSVKEVNQAAKDSRSELEKQRAIKQNLKKELLALQQELGQIINRSTHIEHNVREKKERISLLEKYKEFLMEIRSMKEAPCNFAESTFDL